MAAVLNSHAAKGAMTNPTPVKASVERIGFKLLPDKARVFVRLSQQVVYSAGEPEEGLVTVVLKQTRLGGANNRLPLETSYFGTALQRVTPEEKNGDVVLNLRMRGTASYRIRQQALELQIDIER